MSETAASVVKEAVRSTRSELLLCLLVYVAVYGALLATGWRLEIRWELLQLLPESLLRDRLAESIWHLHAQPPLLNLLLGWAVHVEEMSGLHAETSLGALQFALGLGCVAFWTALARKLVSNSSVRRACLAVLVLHPVFYVSLFRWFYTLHEIFLVSWLAWATWRYLREPGTKRMLWVGAPIVLLALTRSLFHPLWGVGYLILCAFLAGRRPAWKPIAATFGVTLAPLAWPAKNFWVFDFFGYSSWQGFNMSRGLEVGEAPIDPMFSPGRSRESVRARKASRARVPNAFAAVPALTLAEKAPGIPNWNHYAMLAYSRGLQSEVLAHLANDPGDFLVRAAHNYWRGWSLYAGRNAYFGYFDPPARRTWVASWMRGHEMLLFLSPSADPTKGFPGGFAFLFPLALAGIALGPLRDPQLRAFAATQLWTLGWVLAMVLFVDGQEGNRMRFSTEPILWLLVAAAASSWFDRAHRRRIGAPTGREGSA